MSSSAPEMLFVLTANFLDERCIWAFGDPVSSLGGWGVGFLGPLGRGSLSLGKDPLLT